MSSFEVGKRSGSSPDYMLFVYDKIKDEIMVALECSSEDDRETMYAELVSDVLNTFDPSDEVRVYKGHMSGDTINLFGYEDECTECQKVRSCECVHEQ
jgi:hypothetical protein